MKKFLIKELGKSALVGLHQGCVGSWPAKSITIILLEYHIPYLITIEFQIAFTPLKIYFLVTKPPKLLKLPEKICLEVLHL